jgi:hypothetical protein
MARRYETVTTIIPRTAEHKSRTRGPPAGDFVGDRPPGILHQRG